MTATLTLALRTAQGGLLTTQSAMDTVAINVANVNTPGYSRKIANQEQRILAGAGAGAGVQLTEITRKVDEGLLKSLRRELGDFQQVNVQQTFYERMQELFGSPEENTSLSHIITEFTSALETLGVSPDKTLDQSEAVRRGDEVALKLQLMTRTIQELRLQADNQIGDIATDLTNQLANIQELNEKIVLNTAVKLDASDRRDLRDAALDTLSESVDIRFFFRSDGDVVVFTSAGRTLIENVAQKFTHASSSSIAATTTHAEGNLSGIFVGATVATNDITNEIRSGKLKGLIELRDNILTDLQSEIDELAAEVRDVFNQVHNRGASFPGLQSMTGTRIFVAPTTQTMTLDPTDGADDVTIALFNGTGDQQAVTTLETIMTAAGFGTGAWKISDVAATIQAYLRANGAATATAAVNSAGKFAINLNTTTLNLVFRDETAIANGSTLADAEIGFDANGDGTNDETIRGFSNFLGLNDFFVDNLGDNLHESNVLASTFTGTAATITFSDSSGVLGSQAISAGDSLTTIATNITNNVSKVIATLVPDGSGVRLRISHESGSNLVVTQAAGNTFLADVGMHSADVLVAGQLAVRSDIVSSTAKVTRGAAQWDATRGAAGQYIMSRGDDTIVQAMAEAFTATNVFDQAGGIGAKTISFDEYASAVVARNANRADANRTSVAFHESLAEALRFKSDSIRGVNLDEEMASLILLQQAFTASARVIQVIQKMFDALERVVA